MIRKPYSANTEGLPMAEMRARDTIRVDWVALSAARVKLRKATAEAERLTDEIERADLTHTLYKCGAFLDAGLDGALSKLAEIDREEAP